MFRKHHLALAVGERQIRINEETYDVQVNAGYKTILIPVKTRETMGGGHANLFTRDIFKSISVAHEAGYEVIPVVIAESWAGDLNALNCKHVVCIHANPNQLNVIQPRLRQALDDLLPVWREYAEVNNGTD